MSKVGGKRPSPGERVELEVGRIAPQGDMVSHWGRYVVFVEGGLPGEHVRARMIKIETNHGRARVDQVQAASPDRISPPCPVFLQCGGCRFQHAAPEAQLRFKADILKQALKRDVPMKGGSPPYRYRTKAQPRIRISRGRPVMALQERESHRLVDTPDCLLYHERVRRVLDAALWSLPLDVAGRMRNLVVRAAPTTGEALVAAVSLTRQSERLQEWASGLLGREGIVGVLENINPDRGAIIWGSETSTLAGVEEVTEKVAGVSFRIGAADFFQASPEAAEALVAHVAERLGPAKNRGTLWDLYAGVGLFGLCLGSRFKKVILAEDNPGALDRARKAARGAGLKDTEFRSGSVDETLGPIRAQPGDALIVDPPRSGLSPKVRSLLRTAGFQDFIYVSCDPGTLARDLETLEGAYEILDVTGFDLFPQTAHVEAVVHLRAREDRF